MIVGVPKETTPGERRVGLVPDAMKVLSELGIEVVVQTGAGFESASDPWRTTPVLRGRAVRTYVLKNAENTF